MAYNYTEEQVRKAIEGGGTISRVAKSLGCTWPTAKQYIEKFNLLDMLPEAAANLGELAEESMLNILTNAATDKEYAKGVQSSIIFTLKAKRGWIETSGLLLGEDNRSPYEKLLEAIDGKDDKPEVGEGTETE